LHDKIARNNIRTSVLAERNFEMPRAILAGLQHFTTPKCSRECLQHRIVDMSARGRQDIRSTGIRRQNEFPPPRFLIEIGTRTVMVQPSLLILGFDIMLPLALAWLRSVRRPDWPVLRFAAGRRARPTHDQQLDHASLLGWEQLIPKRIEALQRLPDLGFGDVADGLPHGPLRRCAT